MITGPPNWYATLQGTDIGNWIMLFRVYSNENHPCYSRRIFDEMKEALLKWEANDLSKTYEEKKRRFYKFKAKNPDLWN